MNKPEHFKEDPELLKEVAEEAEIISHGPAVIEFPAPNLTNHNWKQHGLSIDCDRCVTPHGFYVEANQLLTGVDNNGYPTFKSISV